MLYLVATPIGNLNDFSLRAIETLKSCDYILCEDTRHSQSLLLYYQIHKPLKSFHQFNEKLKENTIIHDLKAGQKIGLISDAGTPGISDPGEKLIQRCIEEQIEITAIPGPCALIVALICSGLNTNRFQFVGFLPKKEGELRHALKECLFYPGTSICYESPQRLLNALTQLSEIDPTCSVVVARELTKKYEEFKRGTPSELIAFFTGTEVRGEIVLLIAGNKKKISEWENLSPEEHVNYLQSEFKLSKNEAIKMAAEMRGLPKRQIYNQLLR